MFPVPVLIRALQGMARLCAFGLRKVFGTSGSGRFGALKHWNGFGFYRSIGEDTLSVRLGVTIDPLGIIQSTRLGIES